jgi:hypothetical protein
MMTMTDRRFFMTIRLREETMILAKAGWAGRLMIRWCNSANEESA